MSRFLPSPTNCARLFESVRGVPFEELGQSYSDDFVKLVAILTLWDDGGRVVYELSHSMAAMFALTTAPEIDWSRMPHHAFALKIPGGFSGYRVPSDSWVWIGACGHETQNTLVIWQRDVTEGPCEWRFDTVVSAEGYRSNPVSQDPEVERQTTLMYRFVGNLLAFITAHRECVVGKSASWRKAGQSVVSIRAPKDLTVTADFRAAASAAVSAGSLGAVRRALAHVVRGHWRNQPVGEGRKERKLTWVRPHRRGDESLGRVVQRIERITGGRS